jgi:HSP20 family protein
MPRQSKSEKTTTKNDDGGATQRADAPVKIERALSARALPLGPFAFMHQLFDDLERMWTGGRRRYRDEIALAFVPDLEVSRRDGKLVVKCDLPGLAPEDVEVTVDDDALIIAGERRSEHVEEDEGTWKCERSYGTFRRAIALPDDADPSTTEARFDNGVLEIVMDAPEPEVRGRKIDIQPTSEKLAH